MATGGRAWGLLAGLAAVVAATAGEVRAQGREKVSLAVGGVGASVYLQVDVAKALGLFEQEGLDADIQFQKGGAPAATALISGSVDFSANAIDHALKARARGKAVTMVVAFTELPGLVLMVNDRLKGQVKSPADLKGRTLGVSAPGSGTDIILTYILHKHGIKRDETTIVGAGTNTFPPALKGGKIDAGMTLDPYVGQIVSEGYGFPLVDMRTRAGTEAVFGGPYMFTGLLTRDEVVREKPQLVQKVVNVFVKTNRWLASHTPEQVAEVLPADLVRDPKAYADAFRASKEIYPKVGRIPPEGIDAVYKAQEVFQPGNEELKGVKPTDLYTNRFVEAATK
jgi:NitT/TauT family transport system substrate-binding protein